MQLTSFAISDKLLHFVMANVYHFDKRVVNSGSLPQTKCAVYFPFTYGN